MAVGESQRLLPISPREAKVRGDNFSPVFFHFPDLALAAFLILVVLDLPKCCLEGTLELRASSLSSCFSLM